QNLHGCQEAAIAISENRLSRDDDLTCHVTKIFTRMPPRRTRKDSQLSDDGFKSQQSSEQKVRITKRKELFIQQFEKEAQNQINEMEANLNKLLATVDRVFKIELMKMPQSLHTTLIKDLMKEGDTSVGEVTMALT
ncbi:hypothetical protein DNTS_014904, partial [Danionella cerebrum]